MTSLYMLKFKDDFCEIEKATLLSQFSVHMDKNSFGFYVIFMTDDDFFNYKKHVGILYIKKHNA